MTGLTWLAAVVATLPLIFILFYLLQKGASSLTLGFFTDLPAPPGAVGGGMANAIVGTVLVVGVASVFGVPIGIGAGIYLAEKKDAPLATAVRFLADVLNGLPSIVMGIFAWELVVVPMGHFSALAGGLALGAMMIPTVTRTTEEMVRVVPTSLREAALALGYTRWRTALRIVLPTAFAGILTGILVALARIAGETAPSSSPRSATASGRSPSTSRSRRSPCRSSSTRRARTTTGTRRPGQARSCSSRSC